MRLGLHSLQDMVADNVTADNCRLAVLEDALAGHLLGLYAGEMQESQERYSDLMGRVL